MSNIFSNLEEENQKVCILALYMRALAVQDLFPSLSSVRAGLLDADQSGTFFPSQSLSWRRERERERERDIMVGEYKM